MQDVKLPSGRVVTLREPTGLDQEKAIRAATKNRELVALAETFIIDFCIEAIDGKKPEVFTIDMNDDEVRPTTLLSLVDVQALTEIFQTMYMLTEDQRTDYRNYAKKLMGGSSTTAATKSK